MAMADSLLWSHATLGQSRDDLRGVCPQPKIGLDEREANYAASIDGEGRGDREEPAFGTVNVPKVQPAFQVATAKFHIAPERQPCAKSDAVIGVA